MAIKAGDAIDDATFSALFKIVTSSPSVTVSANSTASVTRPSVPSGYTLAGIACAAGPHPIRAISSSSVTFRNVTSTGSGGSTSLASLCIKNI